MSSTRLIHMRHAHNQQIAHVKYIRHFYMFRLFSVVIVREYNYLKTCALLLYSLVSCKW
jgi:hypothetical protein